MDALKIGFDANFVGVLVKRVEMDRGGTQTYEQKRRSIVFFYFLFADLIIIEDSSERQHTSTTMVLETT
jgi:hypothetical protein